MKVWFYFILFIISLSASAGIDALGIALCELSYTGQTKLFDQGMAQVKKIDKYSHNRAMRATLLNHILWRLKTSKSIPELYTPSVNRGNFRAKLADYVTLTDRAMAERWEEYLAPFAQRLIRRQHPSTPINGRSDMSVVETDMGLKIFRSGLSSDMRPQYNRFLGVIRRTFLAVEMNHFFGIGTVPNARFAHINGELGYLSDIAPGSVPAEGFKLSDANPISLANAKAFEFLIGNYDIHGLNFHITSDGRIIVFDHDLTFFTHLVPDRTPGIEAPAWQTYYFGHQLPNAFTNQFITKLKLFTEQFIREHWGRYMTEEEIQGVLLRREVLLAHSQVVPQI